MTQTRAPLRIASVALLLALSASLGGCAPSPLYTGHVKRLAPGAVPRDQFGQPVLLQPLKRRRWFSSRPAPIPVTTAPVPAGPPIIYYQDLRYGEQPGQQIAGTTVAPVR